MPGHIYIAPWEEIAGVTGREYQAPGGNALGVLDLRTLPQMGRLGQVGYGFFTYGTPQIILGSHYLGNDPERRLSLLDRSALETFLALPAGTIQESSLVRVIRELFLDHYDATGLTRWKPVKINRALGFEIALGGFGRLIKEDLRASHPAFQPTLEVYRLDYQRQKQAGISLDALRRWTGYTMLDLFGRMGDDLLPAILAFPDRADGWLPPASAFLETWPTNGSDISTGQDQPWTEVFGDVEVSAGQLRAVGTSAGAERFARCDTNLSSDDHYHQATATVVANAAQAGVLVRASQGTGGVLTTGYRTRVFRESGFFSRRLDKFVNSVKTTLANSATDPGSPVAIKAQADGSSISGLVGAVSLGPVTDTAITGTLTVGLNTEVENTVGDALLDGHQAADLHLVILASGPVGLQQRNLLLHS